MSLIFWVSIIGVFYAYLGYPLSLMVIGVFRQRRVKKTPIEPSVAIIITAYNEEKRIEAKILNTLKLDYPRDRLEIIVASDGSTDRTNDIVRHYVQQEGVKLLAFDKRRGKEFAQKDAVASAKGDVLVFTDVATQLRASGLREIVSNFSDPSVGCVSSEDRLERSDGQTAGEGFYVRYETFENFIGLPILGFPSNFQKRELKNYSRIGFKLWIYYIKGIKMILKMPFCVARRLYSSPGRTYPPYTVAPFRTLSPFLIL